MRSFHAPRFMNHQPRAIHAEKEHLWKTGVSILCRRCRGGRAFNSDALVKTSVQFTATSPLEKQAFAPRPRLMSDAEVIRLEAGSAPGNELNLARCVGNIHSV